MRASLKLIAAVLLALALPVPAAPANGAGLFAADCSRCHGLHGEGTDQGPSLRGVGAIAPDFYLRTGYMPLHAAHDQPARSRVLYTDGQIRALVSFVASFGNGPRIPAPRRGSVAAGQKLFVDHCAGCHQAVAQGGYVTGARVPPLTVATDRQIAEAVRIGPYLMPHFSNRQITPAQLNDIVAYVDYTKHPDDPGGWAIGHLGPWPEGAVSWLLAGGVLVFCCTLLGRRLRS